MLQVARLAPRVLGESSELVRGFLLRQQNPDGGFKDRAGHSDLYYTVFGLEALMALGADLPREGVTQYLLGHGDGAELDLVHVCCLARARATLRRPGLQTGSRLPAGILRRVETYRAQDGGYHPKPRSDSGTAYGAFLAFGACQDLGVEIPDAARLVVSLEKLRTADGAWANEQGAPIGTTNATAAAVRVLRGLGAPISPATGRWLLARWHPSGGFLAAPSTPMPDLLSTATTLHALAGLGVPFDGLREPALDFIDSLWTNEGAFYGHWGDTALDCEYTFYALLALGHLS